MGLDNGQTFSFGRDGNMDDNKIYAFDEIMTTAEAAERWGKSNISVKHLCTGIQGRPPRLTADECRKSGGVWLVTKQGMTRLYGEEKTK
jgi:hypothetical protein